jgi:hypothetical protein
MLQGFHEEMHSSMVGYSSQHSSCNASYISSVRFVTLAISLFFETRLPSSHCTNTDESIYNEIELESDSFQWQNIFDC